MAGFAARKLRSDHIDAADLVLTATADQQEYVVALRPDAAARTFVLGEFGRLLRRCGRRRPPPGDATPGGRLRPGDGPGGGGSRRAAGRFGAGHR